MQNWYIIWLKYSIQMKAPANVFKTIIIPTLTETGIPEKNVDWA